MANYDPGSKPLRVPGFLPTSATLAGLLLAMAFLLPGVAFAQEDAEQSTELIPVNNVSIESAYTLARRVCARAGNSCFDVVTLNDEGLLLVTARPDVITRIVGLLEELDHMPMPETRSFQIIVLSASREGSSLADVPENAQLALQDVRGFLPYTSYSVLGSGWLRTSSYGETTLPGSMNLSARLNFRPSTDATAPILVEGFTVSQRWAGDNRDIMQSTFTINPGETVVVGTSQLNGDDSAVVVLLTAVEG